MLDAPNFLLPALSVHDPGLEIDHDSIQVLDLADHFIGCPAKPPKPALLPQCAMAPVLELCLSELSCSPNRIVNGRSRHGAVIHKLSFRIDFVGEPQFSNVFDPIEGDSQDCSIRTAVYRDLSDLVFA